MNQFGCKLAVLSVTIGLVGGQLALADKTSSPTVVKKEKSSKIQLAILLDTSGSMRGLINQARTQLWKIVNELATAKQNGQTPELTVALYEYGKDSIPKEQGYLRKIVPLTDDLDQISEELFALTTNGGQEYCGEVIARAVKELEWSSSDESLKLIFIAGNEPFDQGGVDYHKSCQDALSKGITVNTIFCGPLSEGIRTGWQHGAQLADGSFLNINQNRKVVGIATPYDQELATLSAQVNKTYVAFGNEKSRSRFQTRQIAQDNLAKQAAPAAAAERAAFKGSGRYKASAWDLVDAIKAGKLKLETIPNDRLPKEMRKMTLVQKKVYLKKKQDERTQIQEKLKKLAAKRKKFIADKSKEQSQADKDDTLDAAIIKSIRTQATRKKFKLDKN